MVIVLLYKFSIFQKNSKNALDVVLKLLDIIMIIVFSPFVFTLVLINVFIGNVTNDMNRANLKKIVGQHDKEYEYMNNIMDKGTPQIKLLISISVRKILTKVLLQEFEFNK